jgi:hypothetical protein
MADEVNWRDKIEDMTLAQMKERIAALDNKEDNSGLTDDEEAEKEELEDLVAEEEEDDVDDGDDDDIEGDGEVADKDV